MATKKESEEHIQRLQDRVEYQQEQLASKQKQMDQCIANNRLDRKSLLGTIREISNERENWKAQVGDIQREMDSICHHVATTDGKQNQKLAQQREAINHLLDVGQLLNNAS